MPWAKLVYDVAGMLNWSVGLGTASTSVGMGQHLPSIMNDDNKF